MARGPDTVFFLSDYGQRDEFAGVVRAVLRSLAPQVVVVDLTHEVAPFGVAAGARVLERALPHLGDGVVLAVVDPGVGSPRRPVALGAGLPERFFVGPDNGLLTGAAGLLGGVSAAVELRAPTDPDGPSTFDGRDVFAPAVAKLCHGLALGQLGQAVEPSSLVRLDASAPTSARLPDGRRVLWCEVTWIDRFGNVELNAGPDGLGSATTLVRPRGAAGVAHGEQQLRHVRAFAQLGPGEVGIIVDASGRLALVVREGSAADALGVAVGDTVGLTEPATRASSAPLGAPDGDGAG
jgi:S-adenosylmethionine hydrolase